MRKELLFSITKKDFEMQRFRSGGKGGQNQNKVESGVRLIHKESGIRGESRSERSQVLNKKLAFKRLIESKEFQSWLKLKISMISDGVDRVDKKTEEQMHSQYLKIEGRENKKWIQI